MVSDHINMRNCIQATRTTHRKAKKVAQPEEFKEPDHVRPSTQREQKPVVPFDYSRYNPTELKEVNKLRIETRIRQLNDQSEFKSGHWKNKFFTNQNEYDFHKYLDEQLALHSNLPPQTKYQQVEEAQTTQPIDFTIGVNQTVAESVIEANNEYDLGAEILKKNLERSNYYKAYKKNNYKTLSP